MHWIQLAEEDDGTLATQLATPTAADYEALTRCVCEGIKFAIDQEDRGAFRVGDYILRPGKIIDQHTREKLEREDKMNMRMESSADSMIREIPRMVIPQNDCALNDKSTFYGNDISLNIVNEDLAQKNNTCMIAQYTVNVRRIVVKQWYDLYTSRHGQPPPNDIPLHELPPASIGAIFMCDGQPAANLSSVIAADNMRYYRGRDVDPEMLDLLEIFPHHKNNDKGSAFDRWFEKMNQRVGYLGKGRRSSILFGKFMALPGAFHAGMKLHNCCSIMFGNFAKQFFAS